MRTHVLFLAVISACARSATHHDMPLAAAGPAEYGPEVVDGYARVRAATAAYRVLDSAVAKGYAAAIPACIADSTHGAMGHHHLNRSYVDNRIEIDRPEILLYERKSDGSYGLNGVEYIIPYRVWPKDSTPPRLLGLAMLRSEPLQLWYMHMWVWTPNRAGLFADWNPSVKCPVKDS